MVHVAQGYGSGAPTDTCWTRYPKHHGTGTQTSRCPYVINTDSDTYTPGQVITFTVMDSTSSLTFSGLEIGVFRSGSSVAGNTEEIVGEFIQLPEDKMKSFDCFPGNKNMATHKNNAQVNRVQLQWKAPEHNVGNLTVRATVLADFVTYWTREEKSLNIDASVSDPVINTSYPVPVMTSLVGGVDLDGCGDTKGCLLYPAPCTGKDCVIAASFTYRSDTDDFLFEMLADTSSAENYISIAFSADEKMGEDETISCVAQGGEMSVQQGYNPSLWNDRLLTRYLSDMEIQQSDGRLQCRFVLSRASVVYRIDETTSEVSNVTFDLDEPWYVQLA